jgi:hypothetical protein
MVLRQLGDAAVTLLERLDQFAEQTGQQNDLETMGLISSPAETANSL